MISARRLWHITCAASLALLATTLVACQETDLPEPVLDAAASADGSVLPDAGSVDASGPVDAGGDAHSLDGSAHGAEAGLQADASSGDGGLLLDAAAAPDASSAGDSFLYSQSGSVCQANQNGGTAACPAQQCYADINRVVATIHSGSLACARSEGCTPAPPGTPTEPGTDGQLPFEARQVYTYDSPELYLSLTFNRVLLTEYTLERLRASLYSGMLAAKILLPEGPLHFAYAAEPVSQDIVSYQDGILHVHIVARVIAVSRRFEGVPSICTIGNLPTICTLDCSYRSAQMVGTNDMPTIDADVHIRIAPLAH